METATKIFTTAIELGFTPLNLVLMVMIYFMGAHTGIFPKFWGKETQDTKDANRPATKAQMDKLSSYYNHDTTEILKSIDGGVKSLNSSIQKLDDQIQILHNTHVEWEKYGIPIRDKK